MRRPPVLSIVVPAYNVEDYLATCLDSMVDVDERVEVIVVDDGSTDGTAAIAEGYEGVSLIRQANRGHGGAINTGVAAATGLYVKTVDADDWLDRVSLAALVLALGGLADADETPDVVVTNFVYDRVDRSEPRPVRSRRRLPVGRIIDWAETTRFRPWEYLLIHSLTYRTEFLRQTGVVLPEHSFYVDNIYAFSPLFEARSLYYLDLDLYHYRIGRPGQSVSETVMVTRLDQQLAVNEAMLDKMTQSRPATRAQARYLLHYLDLVCAI
ncbi:MAG: glycosyltransferase, partial [Propionibacteriaceae bacterium]|nr:glycosyltransferase [Propionibacteriaceae bacterium]